MSQREKNTKTAIGFVLLIFTISIFSPGSYSNDSWAQYNHAVNFYFGDWFEPGLSYVWCALIQLTGNFISLFYLQMCLYWTFVTILTWNISIGSIKFWFATACSLFFVVIAQYIMRDSLLAISWGLAIAILLSLSLSNSITKNELILPIVLLCLGLWIRSNTVLALSPLILACFKVCSNNKYKLGTKTIILSVLFPIGILLGLRAINYSLLKTNYEYPAYKLKMSDIAGISILSGDNLFPPIIKNYPKFNFDKLKKVYSPASFDHIYWPIDTASDLVPFPNNLLNEEVSNSWINAVKKHQFYYLSNRMKGFLYYLRIKKRFKREEYWNVPIFIDPNNPLNISSLPNPVREGFNVLYHKFNNTIFYEAWFWLLLNCIGFGLFILYNRKHPSLYLEINIYVQLSGIIYTLSQFFVYQFDRDFRYNYWNVIVVLIGLCSIMKNTPLSSQSNN